MRLSKTCPLLFLPLCLLMSLQGYSQQAPLYTQYMFNGLLINPAYAGSQEAMSISGLFRKQWTSLDGSPSTQNLTAHTPLKNKKVALGLVLLNDHVGVTSQTGIDAVYAYRLSFSETRHLSLGIQAGYAKISSDYGSLVLKDPNDPAFTGSQTVYDCLFFGTGIYYYTNRFYAGLSSPHVNRISLGSALNAEESSASRSYFFTSGYVFTLSPYWKFKPSTLLKVNDAFVTQADVNFTLLYQEVFWLGVSYRTFSSLSFLAQIQLTNQLSMGYAYDNALGDLSVIGGGGHEFMLSYRFSFFKSNTVTPRDF